MKLLRDSLCATRSCKAVAKVVRKHMKTPDGITL